MASGQAAPVLTGPVWFALGICAPQATCWACSWAYRADLGGMALKVPNPSCQVHGHLTTGQS